MKLRYSGPDDARDLALSGGFITFPRGKWVDVEKAAEAGGIRVEHAVIQARDIAQQDGWEADDTKASKARKAKREGGPVPDGAAASLGPDETTTPAEPATEEKS